METGVVEEQIAVQQNLAAVRLMTDIVRKKSLILLTGLLCASIGFAYTLLKKPYFTATTEIIPPQLKTSSAASLLSQFSMGGGELGGLSSLGSALQAKTQTDTFMVLLGAWPVQEEMVKRFDLRKAYGAKTASEARIGLGKHTELKADKGFVFISVTDSDPQRAATLANGYIGAVRTFMRGLSLTEASQRRAFYEDQVAGVKENLSQAEAGFKQMQQSNRMLTLDSQARTSLQGAAELRSNITLREIELQRMRSYLTDSNSQVQIAESELAALRTKLAQAESNSSGGFSGGAGLGNLPAAELNFIRASRELKYQEALYELMVKQYEASRIDEARDASTIQVIEPALPPEKKAGPHRSFYALGGFVFGVAIALVWIIVRFWRAMLSPEGNSQLAELRRAAFQW